MITKNEVLKNFYSKCLDCKEEQNLQFEQMIYVHIPFCDRKCYYCNFVSFVFDKAMQEKYFENLYDEIKGRKNSLEVTSIYFGGGTPSCVMQKYIIQTINLIKNNYHIAKDCEITIECNPQNVNEEKLRDYFEHGFNRISFGVQSLNEKKLKKIGRFQTKKQTFQAIKNAKKVGFKNISVDFLIGLENQTFFELKKHVKKLIKLGVKHISAYMLILEPETKLSKMLTNKEIKLISDEKAVEIYNKLYYFLKRKNFDRYEVSNFALKGFECKHNLGYWKLKNYLGFGLAAHSLENRKNYLKNVQETNLISFINEKKRSSNSTLMEEYLKGQGRLEEKLTKKEIREEKIMLGLRTHEGVKKEIIGENPEIEKLKKSGFIEEVNGFIKVCEKQYGVLNQIILKLI